MPPFTFIIFQIAQLYLCWPVMKVCIYAYRIAGVTDTHQHAHHLLVEMGSHELFAWAGLELQYSLSLPPQ
jgi:hypothetical protein